MMYREFTLDPTTLLRNPATGWMIYIDQDGSSVTFPDDPGRYLEASAFWRTMDAAARHSSILYLRLPWAQWEPREGQYTWESSPNVQAILQGARERGLQIALRVYVDHRDCHIQATPDWVRQAGARGETAADAGGKWNPYQNDPVFRVKFEAFVQALARRFDDPDEVSFVDGEGLGRWGEMHGLILQIPQPHAPNAYQASHREACDWVTSIYRRAFKRVILGHQFNKWEFGRAQEDTILFERNYVLRRDGLGSPVWFKQAEKDQMKSYWPSIPVFAENCYWHLTQGGLDWVRGDGYPDLRTMLEAVMRDAEEIHANTLDLRTGADVPVWLEQAPDLIARFAQRGGYRLGLQAVAFPEQICGTQPVPISHRWRNLGWGILPNRAWNNRMAVAFALRDAAGHPVALALSESNPGRWTNGLHLVDEQLTFPATAPGRYELSVTIVDRGDLQPRIALAVEGFTQRQWLPLGLVEVSDGNGSAGDLHR